MKVGLRTALGEHRDAGAIAVITAVIVVFALLPVTGLALTTYTRSGVTSEMVRAADSGALAGAAALAVVDLAQLNYNNTLPAGTLFPNLDSVVGPNGTACRAALTAAKSDPTSLSKSFAGPLDAAGLPQPACDATYAKSPAFGSCVDEIFNELDAATTPPVVPSRSPSPFPVQTPGSPPPTPLPSVSPPSTAVPSPSPTTISPGGILASVGAQVPSPVVPSEVAQALPTPVPSVPQLPTPLPSLPDITTPPVPALTDVQKAVRNLLPAFLENGVKVTLTYQVFGPLDDLVPGTRPVTTTTSVSTARRRFKALIPQAALTVPSPTIGLPDTVTAGIGAVNGAANGALTDLQNDVVRRTQELLTALAAAAGTTVPSTVGTAFGNAVGVATTGPMGVQVSAGASAGASFGATVPRPIGGASAFSPVCTVAVVDFIQDLSDAFTVSPSGPTPFDCFTRQILGLGPQVNVPLPPLPSLSPLPDPLASTPDPNNPSPPAAPEFSPPSAPEPTLPPDPFSPGPSPSPTPPPVVLQPLPGSFDYTCVGSVFRAQLAPDS